MKIDQWKYLAIAGWVLFVTLSAWHFVIEPLERQVTVLTNAVQQVMRGQPKEVQ